jgi:hypothetical protein
MEETAALQEKLRSGSRLVRIEAAKVISSSSIQDVQVYKTVEQILKDNIGNPSEEKGYIDEMSWMCKALASSGDMQYAATLNAVMADSPNAKLKAYAKQSLELIPNYVERNRQIHQAGDYDPSLTEEEVRFANMIRSEMTQLRRDGAKKIIRSGTTNQALFDIVSEELLKGYNLNTTDPEHIDTMAWFCKALAGSGNKRYIATLKEVAGKASNAKLKKHAESSLKALDSSY